MTIISVGPCLEHVGEHHIHGVWAGAHPVGIHLRILLNSHKVMPYQFAVTEESMSS